MKAITVYDAVEAIKAQKRYCDEHEVPMFIPANGWCLNCGCNIFEPHTYRREPIRTFGIDVETAGSKLITSCPLCNATFCD